MDILAKDLNLLRTFLLLAQEKNLSQAAEKLHLSQPALSYQLKRLREEFDDILFVRTRSGYQLTEKSLALVPQVQSILTSIEGLYTKPCFDLKEHKGDFVLASTSYFETIAVNPLLRLLKKNAPQVTLRTVSLAEKTPFRELEDGTYDLAVAAFLETPPKSFRLQEIGRDHQVCVMRKNHPILRQTWSLKKYLQQEHIKIDVPIGSISRIDRLLSEKKLGTRKIVGRFNNFLTPALALKESDVLLTCPERLARFYCEKFDLVQHPLPCPKLELRLQILWHERKDQDPFQMWIRKELQTIFSL